MHWKQKKTQAHEGNKARHYGKRQGKRPKGELRTESEAHRPEQRSYRNRDGRRYGGEGSRTNRLHDQQPRYEPQYVAPATGESQGSVAKALIQVVPMVVETSVSVPMSGKRV